MFNSEEKIMGVNIMVLFFSIPSQSVEYLTDPVSQHSNHQETQPFHVHPHHQQQVSVHHHGRFNPAETFSSLPRTTREQRALVVTNSPYQSKPVNTSVLVFPKVLESLSFPGISFI